MTATADTTTALYALREQVTDRTAGYAVRHPQSGALVSNRSFDNGYCVQPLGVPHGEALALQASLSAATGVTWVLELAPAPCPACQRVIWADDLDFAYPLNRERTRYRAGCNLHDFGCGHEVQADSFEGVIRRWNGQ